MSTRTRLASIGLLAWIGCGTDTAAVITSDAGPRRDAGPPIVIATDGGVVGASDGGIAIGDWREEVLGSDGEIDWAAWEDLARRYHEPDVIAWRLGPSASDFFPGSVNEDPVLYGPDPDGLFRAGTDRDLADR
ncbi:MAG: hypothetical protein MUE69_15870, partial [Myxococcota bacterium]|nr:hypothetical protein [Myxococcota bacterium]